MPRLFTGLEIPPDVADKLFWLRGGLAGARWIDRENYHITLRFIGDIDGATADDVESELARIRRSSFEVTLGSLSVFGGDKPRALVVRALPAKPLMDLQAEHERVARRIGIRPEPRKYAPHVTLARLRATSDAAAAAFLETRGLFRPQTLQVQQFVLFSSRDSVGGGPYVVEATYPLD